MNGVSYSVSGYDRIVLNFNYTHLVISNPWNFAELGKSAEFGLHVDHAYKL